MNRIKELRRLRGLTIAQLSKETKIPKTSLTNYENGKRTPRDMSTWEELADFFKVDTPYLMGFDTATQKTINAERQDNQFFQDEFVKLLKERNFEKLANTLNSPDQKSNDDLGNILSCIADGYVTLYESDRGRKRFEAYRKILFKLEKYATLEFDDNDDLAQKFLLLKRDEEAVKEFFDYTYYLLLDEHINKK